MTKIGSVLRFTILKLVELISALPLIARLIAIMMIAATGLWHISYLSWNVFDLTIGRIFQFYTTAKLAYCFVTPVSSNNTVLKITGWFILILGVSTFFISLLQLGINWYKKGNYSLITSGFYNYSRHPQNLGIIIAIIGFTLIKPVRIGDVLSLMVFTFLVVIESHIEEIELTRRFSTEFKQFQDVTSFLISYFRCVSLPMLSSSFTKNLIIWIITFFGFTTILMAILAEYNFGCTL